MQDIYNLIILKGWGEKSVTLGRRVTGLGETEC